MTSWAKPVVRCVCVSKKGTLVLGRQYTVLEVLEFEQKLYVTVDSPPDVLGNSSYLPSRFKPLVSRDQDQDVELFQRIANGAKVEDFDHADA